MFGSVIFGHVVCVPGEGTHTTPANQAINISLQLLWSVLSEFHTVISYSVYRNNSSDNLHWQQAVRLEAKTAVGRKGEFPTFFLAASL